MFDNIDIAEMQIHMDLSRLVFDNTDVAEMRILYRKLELDGFFSIFLVFDNN